MDQAPVLPERPQVQAWELTLELVWAPAPAPIPLVPQWSKGL